MQINIEKRHLFIISALIIFLAGTILVVAVNPTTKPNPGHYSQEVMVNSKGIDIDLQQAIEQLNSDVGGRLQSCNLVISERYSSLPSDPTCPVGFSLINTISFVAAAEIYCYRQGFNECLDYANREKNVKIGLCCK